MASVISGTMAGVPVWITYGTLWGAVGFSYRSRTVFASSILAGSTWASASRSIRPSSRRMSTAHQSAICATASFVTAFNVFW